MKKEKIVITLLLLAAAVTYFALSNFGDSMIYYKTVDELIAEQDRFKGKLVHLNGVLEEGSLSKKPGTDQFRFRMIKN